MYIKNMNKTLILLRGLPGSGKSTVAKLFPKAPHYEADMYFMDAEGNYKFEPRLLKVAHNWCAIQTQKAMVDEYPVIVVSNTFTQKWEMDTYYDLADMHGYRVTSLIVENRHGGENIHGVPTDKLEIMKNRFEIKL
jgi:predicted kinase